jgi:hypothetical protein
MKILLADGMLVQRMESSHGGFELAKERRIY